jgi:cytochrome bd-type quinol oxidase subunit 2
LTRPSSDRVAARWATAALAWAIVMGVVWLFAPTGQSTSATVSTDGTTVVTESSTSTLLQSEGPSVVIVLAVPVVIAGLAVAASGRRCARQIRFVCGGVLAFACLLGAASVGLPYAPAVAALLISGATTGVGLIRTDRSPCA